MLDLHRKCPYCDVDWVFPLTADYIKVPAVADTRLFIQCYAAAGEWDNTHLIGIYSNKMYPIPLSIEDTMRYANEEKETMERMKIGD